MTVPIRLGIFGWPVAHSKSPQMHEAAAQALGIELRYDRFAVEPEHLGDAVKEKHAAAIDGYNVTVPHKEAIVALLDDVVAAAHAIGAVNTVVRSGDRYVGHNTDAAGLVRSIAEAGVPVGAARVAIVGAGGAARAAVVGLADAGAASIVVLARRPEQAETLVRNVGPRNQCQVVAAPLSDAAAHFGDATLVVQATSATLASNPQAGAFAASLPIDVLPADAAVFDMVYQPRLTSVLARARARGLVTVDGLGMLLHQGAIAFEMWTGVEPPLQVMRAALEA